jgi:hypothetical protein
MNSEPEAPTLAMGGYSLPFWGRYPYLGSPAWYSCPIRADWWPRVFHVVGIR